MGGFIFDENLEDNKRRWKGVAVSDRKIGTRGMGGGRYL
jgi:hypothetical protein